LIGKELETGWSFLLQVPNNDLKVAQNDAVLAKQAGGVKVGITDHAS
jgi:hypothetical protein